MDVGQLVAILTAVAAWAAIYLQRREVLLSEREINRRVSDIEEVMKCIEEERKQREAQIHERTTAHSSLDVHYALSDIHIRSVSNDVLILRDLLVFQQLSAIYLRYSAELDQRDPKLPQDFADLCLSMIHYVGAANNVHTVTNTVSTWEDYEKQKPAITKAVNDSIAALEKVHAVGLSLVRRLDSLNLISMSDGRKLADLFVHITATLDRAGPPLERLKKYGITF